jgi:hypothetical protein
MGGATCPLFGCNVPAFWVQRARFLGATCPLYGYRNIFICPQQRHDYTANDRLRQRRSAFGYNLALGRVVNPARLRWARPAGVTIAVINNVMTGGPRPYVCCLSVRFALLPQTKPHPLLSAAPVNHKGSDGFGGVDHLRQRDVFVGAVNTHRAIAGAKVDGGDVAFTL